MTDLPKAFSVHVGEFVFSFSKADIDAADLVKKSENEFNLISQHRSVNAKLLEAGVGSKKLKLEIDGESFDILIRDELDLMLDKMGFDAGAGRHIREIRAPMPGLVIEIAVADGQDVVTGDKILILEAMKMENSILTQANAKIKRIAVSAGQAVEKGQVLVELE